MKSSSRFELASRLVAHSDRHVFLTGRAGTGKTTFLRHLLRTTPKKAVVIAPTGVAAVNAGGVTMHSFFYLPFGMFIPDMPTQDLPGFGERAVTNKQTLFKNLRYQEGKRTLLEELELLVIDEVSMLRADALDAMDTILRSFRRNRAPFGGVQMLYIGDLFQLPPVVTRDEERLFFQHYRSPFFFDARVMHDAPPMVVELDKIHRQTDSTFISLLNAIRSNTVTRADMELLEKHYNPNAQAADGVITLTTHNHLADRINRSKLDALAGAVHSFEGELKGSFNESAIPGEKVLQLKVGAQVMFTKNDTGENRRWYNGRIGRVERITPDDELFVRFPDGTEVQVEKHVWRQIRYKFNEGKDSIDEEELGSWKQYPLRLAWAVTIHKSQGLTFDKAVIDAGAAFAPGQVYVALSRLTSMEGLTLKSRIPAGGIAMPEAVCHFCAHQADEDVLREIVQHSERDYARQQLMRWFDLSPTVHLLRGHHAAYERRVIPDSAGAEKWSEGMMQRAEEHAATARKFLAQLSALLQRADVDGYGPVHERVEKAKAFFTKALDNDLLEPLRAHAREYSIKSRSKKYFKDLEELESALLATRKSFEQAERLVRGLAGGVMDLQLEEEKGEEKTAISAMNGEAAGRMNGTEKDARAERRKQRKEEGAGKPAKGDSVLVTYALYKEGKSLAEIAEARSMAKTTIEGHLAECVKQGRIRVDELVGPEHRAMIEEALLAVAREGLTLGGIKEQLPAEVTYAEIKAVQAHRAWKAEGSAAGQG